MIQVTTRSSVSALYVFASSLFWNFSSCVYEVSSILKVPDSRLTILKHFLPSILEVVFEELSCYFRNIFITKSGPGWLSRFSDSIRAGRYGDPVLDGARFSTPVRTGPEFHQYSYTVGTGSFPELERPGHVVDHPPPSSAEVKEREELYL
jgi:hypothetical protein